MAAPKRNSGFVNSERLATPDPSHWEDSMAEPRPKAKSWQAVRLDQDSGNRFLKTRLLAPKQLHTRRLPRLGPRKSSGPNPKRAVGEGRDAGEPTLDPA